MEKIIFLQDKEGNVYNAAILNITKNMVKITFIDNIPNDGVLLGGFYIANENNNKNMSGEYYNLYNTLYRKINDTTFILSNDGSIYIEPEETPNSEPYVPTEEELQIQFETAKLNKINELSSICQSTIYAGVDVGDKHYSYTLQDQANLENAINIAVQTSLDIPYHADGESCTLYSLAQLQEIYVAEQVNLTKHQTYFNQMKQYIIDTFTDKSMIDELNNIVYGTELTEMYLDSYNNVIAQSMLIVQALSGEENETNN